MQPHTIHPSTFDSLFQLEPFVSGERVSWLQLCLPILARSLSLWTWQRAQHRDCGALQHWQHTIRDSTCAFYAYQKMQDGSYRPVVKCNDARSRAVGECDADDEANSKMTYRVDWKQDIDFMNNQHF
ncbi:hypothetical protein FSHL1_007634 [Fusarium sambucinum]